MSYEATVEFKFDATYTHDYSRGFGSTIGDDDFIPEEHFVITAPAADLSCRQYFKLFEKFMLAVGMSPDNIRSGAMSLVLNEWVNDADQRKVCDEYEVTRNEDLHEKFKEWKKRDEEIERLNHPDGIPCVDRSSSYRKLYQENLDLKAKLSRLQNPDASSYTDEEIEAKDYEAANQANEV